MYIFAQNGPRVNGLFALFILGCLLFGISLPEKDRRTKQHIHQYRSSGYRLENNPITTS
jgi:hypothetical protein